MNAEKASISGNRTSVINQWMKRLELGSKVNPIYGPIHPRRPDNILRRMVRGMVPRKKPKGATAMKMLRVYIGVPTGLDAVKTTKFAGTAATRPIPLYVTMADLSKSLGWNE